MSPASLLRQRSIVNFFSSFQAAFAATLEYNFISEFTPFQTVYEGTKQHIHLKINIGNLNCFIKMITTTYS